MIHANDWQDCCPHTPTFDNAKVHNWQHSKDCLVEPCACYLVNYSPERIAAGPPEPPALDRIGAC